MTLRTALRARWALPAVALLLAAAVLSPLPSSFAQEGGPASPAVGASVPESYFGPMPSTTLGAEERLVGPVQLLRSGEMTEDGTEITIPLYRGQMRDGEPVWYILTDTTDRANADGLGLNFASKLAYAAVGAATRNGRLEADTTLTFDAGRVDFAPERTIVPGTAPNFFPPASATPGSVGDAEYSPLVRIVNQPGTPIYNAPVIAQGVEADQLDSCTSAPDHSVVHDRVVRICLDDPERGGPTVTIALTPIFSFARPSVYMSMEASDPVVAVLDNATFTPALGDIQTGGDDSAFSAVERLFVTVNGPTGVDNPQRQGLNSALSDGDGTLPPLHAVGGLPTIALDYSPLWDINLGEWTQEAIDNGWRSRLIDEFQILGLVEAGAITGSDGAPYGSVGIVVNCPIVARLL